MITGKNICLRAIEPTDLPHLLSWRNEPELRKYFREYRELNMEQQTAWWNYTRDDSNTVVFAIVTSQYRALMGACGLTYIQWRERIAELSLYIAPPEEYIDDACAPEAFGMMLEYGFKTLGMNKLFVEAFEFNEKMIALCGKFNLKFDGTLRDNCYHDGRHWDSYIYSALAREHDTSTTETHQ